MRTRNKKAQILEAAKPTNDYSSDTELNKDQPQLKIDHELFLEAYEKPTQIYRYLRQRNLKCPIFLQRNLSFMRRMRTVSRRTKSKSEFKLESMLEQKVSENCEADKIRNKKCMNLTFLGFYNNLLEKNFDKVSVEVIVVKPKITIPFFVKSKEKKRKSTTVPYVQSIQNSIGFIEIQTNPSEDHLPSSLSSLSISLESFKLANGQIRKCYLLFRIHHTPNEDSSWYV